MLPSLDIGFGGEDGGGEDGGGGSYHSVYDTFYNVTEFDDPGSVYGAVLSKMIGRLVLRAADSPLVPARYSDLATTVSRYVSEVKKLGTDQRDKDRALRDLTRDLTRENAFKLASHPDDRTIAPEDKGVTPLIDMLALEDAADRLTRAAHTADAAFERIPTMPIADQVRISTLLNDIDQLLVDRAGLLGRPWFRNLIYAPGTLTGYGAKTLPGLREAISALKPVIPIPLAWPRNFPFNQLPMIATRQGGLKILWPFASRAADDHCDEERRLVACHSDD